MSAPGKLRLLAKVLVVNAGLALAGAFPAGAETLADALVSAYRTSGLLEQNRALLRAADEDVAQATAALRPVLNYTLASNYSSISETTMSNLQLSAKMVLFDFGRSKLRREIARENVLSLRAALAGVEQKVLLRAVSAYAGVQRDQAIAQLRRKNVTLIAEQLRAARDRFDLGQATRTDVAFAEARLAAAKSALAAARGNLAVSREEYRAVTGHYPASLAALPKPPATAHSAAAALEIARRNNPDLLQAQHSARVADLNQELAMAAVRPTLAGQAQATVDQDRRDSSSVGLVLSGPIYQGGALAAKARKAAAQRDAARAGLHLAASGVEQKVNAAWARLAVADAGLKANAEQVRAARLALRGVREEADVGSRTILDVLNAEQDLSDAETRRVSAGTDRYLAVYNLLSAMGILSAEHLKLGVPVYDPQAYYNAVSRAPAYRVSPEGQRLDGVLKALGRN